MREIIKLTCVPCVVPGRSNYFLTKNKKTKTEKLLTKKYCKFCKTHTDHKEAKV